MVWLLLVALLNAAYVAALPSATVFYIANVLLHLVLGAAVVVWLLRRNHQTKSVPLALGAILGIYLIFGGATTDHRGIVIAHVAFGVAGLAILLPRWRAPLAALTILAAVLRL